ncbi:L-2-hydroxyglutarate dehydrogenase, mitochondrial-like [Uloborus diversus]|uniref:L-2-hydroxyglutarate dehydrogenase, mitochondrial-like n=1 Tax=Uloborus diversus TaxID=327109 RepID=UPI0024094037|nr:L-2-hydroxyglutarate dehydrogenase, mitochondrial-like [Uloborus diversus]
MQRLAYDVVVVGGGIIGTATARELLLRNPGLKLALVEKEKAIAQHQSGHNSGVVHSGLYYTPGSLKAKLCVEGLDLAYQYCTKKNIPYKKCGKLVVAVEPEEIGRLGALYRRALENGVKDIRLLGPEDIRKMEPHIQGLKAIWSPSTGIVDWKQVTRCYADDCRTSGADLYLDFEVKHFVARGESGCLVCGKSTSIPCKWVVTCGGLQSDLLSGLTGCPPAPQIVPFRGEYLVLKPEKAKMISTNIYPVPHPGLPFLGVHFTPRMDGSVWLGPNAVLAFKREGYRFSDLNPRDLSRLITSQGLRKLAGKHLLFGLNEMYKSFNIGAQVAVLKKYFPPLTTSDVVRGPSGVRAQAIAEDGELVDDFVFDEGREEFRGRVLHVRNAPSPAATSSLAIAKVVADKAEELFRLHSPS